MNISTMRRSIALALLGCLSATTSAQVSSSKAQMNDNSRVWPREPFQRSIRADWNEGMRSAGDSFQVPSGKRLVIEYIGGNYETLHEQEVISTIVLTVADGEREGHHVQIPKTATFNTDVDNLSPGVERNLRPENERNIYSGGQLVRLYADPGSVVDIGVWRDDWVCRFPCGTVSVEVSGYLLDVRSPELSP